MYCNIAEPTVVVFGWSILSILMPVVWNFFDPKFLLLDALFISKLGLPMETLEALPLVSVFFGFLLWVLAYMLVLLKIFLSKLLD